MQKQQLTIPQILLYPRPQRYYLCHQNSWNHVCKTMLDCCRSSSFHAFCSNLIACKTWIGCGVLPPLIWAIRSSTTLEQYLTLTFLIIPASIGCNLAVVLAGKNLTRRELRRGLTVWAVQLFMKAVLSYFIFIFFRKFRIPRS